VARRSREAAADDARHRGRAAVPRQHPHGFGRGLLVDPMRVAIDVELPSHPARAIRIAQTGRARGIWWWSVDELSVWSVRAND